MNTKEIKQAIYKQIEILENTSVDEDAWMNAFYEAKKLREMLKEKGE